MKFFAASHPAVHAGLVASIGIMAALAVAPGVAYGEAPHSVLGLHDESGVADSTLNGGQALPEAGDSDSSDGAGGEVLGGIPVTSNGSSDEQMGSTVEGEAPSVSDEGISGANGSCGSSENSDLTSEIIGAIF